MQFLIDAESPLVDPTRSELHPAAELFGQVIALAADDCRRALQAPAYSALTDRQMIESCSAAVFLLSVDGQAMICATGMGQECIKLATLLAKATLTRLNLSADEIRGTPQEWCKAIELASRSGAVRHNVTPISGAVRFRQESFQLVFAA